MSAFRCVFFLQAKKGHPPCYVFFEACNKAVALVPLLLPGVSGVGPKHLRTWIQEKPLEFGPFFLLLGG